MQFIFIALLFDIYNISIYKLKKYLFRLFAYADSQIRQTHQ